MTNRDILNSLSNEELSDFILNRGLQSMVAAHFNVNVSDTPEFWYYTVQWLESEVEEQPLE